MSLENQRKLGCLARALDLMDRMLSGGNISSREHACLLGAKVHQRYGLGDLQAVPRRKLQELYFQETGRDLRGDALEVFRGGRDCKNAFGERYPPYVGPQSAGQTPDWLASISDVRKRRALQRSITEEELPAQNIFERVLAGLGVTPGRRRTVRVDQYRALRGA